MNRIMKESLNIKEYMLALRHTIHQYPELGFQEVKTTALIEKELKEMGIEIFSANLETGMIGYLKGKKSGPTIALRADIDALPIQEATGLPYASTNNGIMHACGHDGHTAILLGVIKLLSTFQDQIRGNVLFLFQPAEETLFGALKVIETGVLEKRNVSIVMGFHGSPVLPLGKMGCISGPAMAAADKFTVTIRGRGGHGAYPHQTHDPLLTASQIITSLQSIVSRQMDPLDNVVLSVCTIQGGDAFNIIPEEVQFGGTIRCLREEIRETMRDRMERIISGISSVNHCQGDLEYIKGVPVLYNDPALVEELIQSTVDVFGEESIFKMNQPFMGSEDFAFYLETIPGLYMHIGLNEPEKEKLLLHNELYDFNDKALAFGAGVVTAFVLNHLS